MCHIIKASYFTELKKYIYISYKERIFKNMLEIVLIYCGKYNAELVNLSPFIHHYLWYNIIPETMITKMSNSCITTVWFNCGTVIIITDSIPDNALWCEHISSITAVLKSNKGKGKYQDHTHIRTTEVFNVILKCFTKCRLKCRLEYPLMHHSESCSSLESGCGL